MLTKNYYALARYHIVGNSFGDGYVYDVNNTKKSFSLDPPIFYYMTSIVVGDISASTYGIRMGTGTRAPALKDINLESPIVTGLSIINSPVRERIVYSDRVEYPVSFTVRNTTSEDITVSELGMFASASSSSYGILVDRTVLDEPVVIPAGERRMITYTIVFNDPNM